MDFITRDIRKETKFQTKTSFNVKENTLVAKFRENNSSNWINILDNKEKLPDNIINKIEEKDWENYVIDEKKCLTDLTNF